MNRDEMTGDDMTGDDFWGATPDWTDGAPRPRREKRSGDVTGAIKGLWAAAMTAGADGTREHRVFDATAPHAGDDIDVGPQMFDDIEHDIHDHEALDDVERRGVAAGPSDGRLHDPTSHATTEVPVIDVFHDGAFAEMAPVSMSERADRRTSGGIDPLLMRIGAVAVATTLLVPLVIGLSSGDDEVDTVASASTVAAASPIFETDSNAAADASASGTEGATPTGLDPATLPPAIPVNVDTTTDEAATEQTDSGDLAAGSDNSTSTESGNESSDGGDPSPSADITQDDATDDDSTENDGTGEATSDASVDEPATADDGAERVTNCAIDYTVVAGDFWLRLADAAGVPLAELLEANGATVDTPLYPGSEICLPAGATTPATPSATTPTTTTAPNTTTATTTTPTTTTAPTTTDAPDPAPNTDATPAEVEQIIRDVWPDELEERALVIAYRESNYVPTAKNYCCYGLFQIYWNVHRSWLADIGITSDQQLYDPETNARAAYTLYQRSGGWGPWSQTDY